MHDLRYHQRLQLNRTFTSVGRTPQGPHGRWGVLLTLLLSSLLVTACGGSTASPSLSPLPTATEMGTITWAPCPADDPVTGGNPELLCAELDLPRDYADPSGPTIAIALAMLPAADQEGRIGPLLLNFGGPGASGINTLADSGRGAVPAEIGNRFDLVTWDPRGVQRSTPVKCLNDAEMDAWISDPGIASSPTATDWAGALKDAQWFADRCAATSGDLLPFIGTTASARDMESIRVAMDVPTLDYLGFSYGTSLGAVFATLYPASVGHFILDGSVNPMPTDDSEYGEQGVSIQGALDRMLAWCDADSACPFGNGHARTSMDKLFAALDKNPLPLADGRMLNSTLAWTGIILTLYNRDYWDYAVQALDEVARKKSGELIALLADAYTDRSADGTFRSNLMQAFPAINCTDHPASASIAKYRAIYERFKDRAPDFAAGQAASGLLCGVWPAVNADPLPDLVNGAGAAPILVVGTTGDPATPYAWSVAMAKVLESGVLLTYVGEGHTGVGGKSECIDSAAITFLIQGEPPADGTRCK